MQNIRGSEPPEEIDSYLHQSCAWYYRPIQKIFLSATTHTMLDVVKAKLTLMLHIGGGKKTLFFKSLYVGVGAPCLPITTLALHKVHVLACIGQHLLVEFGGNLAMCH